VSRSPVGYATPLGNQSLISSNAQEFAAPFGQHRYCVTGVFSSHLFPSGSVKAAVEFLDKQYDAELLREFCDILSHTKNGMKTVAGFMVV
jgi:hypothetical protein